MIRTLLFLLIALAGCAKHPAPTLSTPTAPRTEGYHEDRPKYDPDEIVIDWPKEAVPQGPIYFEYNSSALRDTAKAAALADYLRAHPSSIIDLAGHTSPEGTVDYNLALAARRAESVRIYLQAAGIPTGRIRTKAFGEESLVTDDPAQYHLDRRVEFIVLEDTK